MNPCNLRLIVFFLSSIAILFGIAPADCSETKVYACERALAEPPWSSTRTVCVGHTAKETSGSAGSVLLQSFVPRCDTIEAAELQVGGGTGWEVLELLDSSGAGEPGKALARAFVWRGADCGIQTYGPTRYYFGKTSVMAGRKYFLRYLRNSGTIPFGFTGGDMYKDGELSGLSDDRDLVFRVFSEAGDPPYMRRISASTACITGLSDFIIMKTFVQKNIPNVPVNNCREHQRSGQPGARPDSTQWILSHLLSAPYEVREEGYNAFRALPDDAKNDIVKVIFAHLNDEEETVRKTAREIIKRIGYEARIILPELLKGLDKGATDLDLLAALRAGEAVPPLLRLLKETGDLEVAKTLETIGGEEATDALVDYYMPRMRREAKKLELDPIDLRDPGNLPQGCIMWEFLPEKLAKTFVSFWGDGVEMEPYDFVFSDGGAKGIKIEEAANLLGRNIVADAGIRAVVFRDCRIGVADEIRRWAGRDARPIYFREGCQPRDEYPEHIQALVPPTTGHSGITLGGLTESECKKMPGCWIFSKTEYDRLLGFSIPYYTSEAKFLVGPCLLEKDHQELIEKAKRQDLASSTYRSDVVLRDFLAELSGKWCGLADSKPGYGELEMRLTLADDKGVLVGKGLQAWRKYGTGRPSGRAVHQADFELIPMRMSAGEGGPEAEFSYAGKYHNHAKWHLSKIPGGLRLSGNGRDFTMTRSCKGFWDESAWRAGQ